MEFDPTRAAWLNQPARSTVNRTSVSITTDAGTDLWKRTYYGFRFDSAPALVLESESNFSFTFRAAFGYQRQFDQCGALVYLDGDNWCKASVELEDEGVARLGSVVTNEGHSDWASTDIKPPREMWYRVSRRGPDFLIEVAPREGQFRQIRIFHLHRLGETTTEMGKADPPLPAVGPVRFGVYACSPQDSSFEAHFDRFVLGPCVWRAH